MLSSFLESIKYVGHLVPVAFLRIFIGTYYLQSAWLKFQTDFLGKPKLAAQVAELLPSLTLPSWYLLSIEKIMVQNWQNFGLGWMAFELAVGISYLLGYVVRPIALLAALWSYNMMLLSTPENLVSNRLFMVVHLTLAGVGAGRCLGIDYYFYKRQRGLWW